MKNLIESSIYENVLKEMVQIRTYRWDDNATAAIIFSTFEAMATFLGQKKSKDNPVVIMICDKNGGFHFGASVEFDKEGDDDEGSWSLNYSFKESDFDITNATVYKIPESQEANHTLVDVAFKGYSMRYSFAENNDPSVKNDGSPTELITCIFDIIRDYMKANVTIDPQLDITNYAVLTARADGNDVAIGIEPDAKLKQHVKDDKENA
jgi:hypothetical protein